MIINCVNNKIKKKQKSEGLEYAKEKNFFYNKFIFFSQFKAVNSML